MLALYSKNGTWKFLLNLGLERAFSSQHPRLHLLYSSLYICVCTQWCHCLRHYKVQFKKHGSNPVLLGFTLRRKTHRIHRLVSRLIWKLEVPMPGGAHACAHEEPGSPRKSWWTSLVVLCTRAFVTAKTSIGQKQSWNAVWRERARRQIKVTCNLQILSVCLCPDLPQSARITRGLHKYLRSPCKTKLNQLKCCGPDNNPISQFYLLTQRENRKMRWKSVLG